MKIIIFVGLVLLISVTSSGECFKKTTGPLWTCPNGGIPHRLCFDINVCEHNDQGDSVFCQCNYDGSETEVKVTRFSGAGCITVMGTQYYTADECLPAIVEEWMDQAQIETCCKK
eukprot:343334_1